MPIKHSWSLLWTVAFFASVGVNVAHAAPLMIVGNDEKLLWDDNSKPIISPAGKDSVLIVDLAEPENPKIVANLPLKNSVVGPPVNVAIDPMNSVALVADSIDVIRDGDALKMGPDNKVYVIDLKANPPKHAGTITVGKQPSGLSFNSAGNLALVTNRADKSVSVLSVKGTDVKVIDTIDMGGIVSHAVFTPDGKRALVVKFNDHKVSLLDVDGDKVTYSKLDLPTGQWPYNVAVAPSGKIALTADNGGAGSSDGSVDTVSVVDLEVTPPRITDRVVVGDGPEGLAISPTAMLRSPLSWPAPIIRMPIFTNAMVASRCWASKARRSPSLATSRSADCRKGRCSRPTESICWSAIISTRTFLSSRLTARRSLIPASVSSCRAIQPRCGSAPNESRVEGRRFVRVDGT
jgi:DNA-binding beta-propeller fold protein YncE